MPILSKSRYLLIALLLFLFTFLAAVFYVRPLWHEVANLALGRDDKLNQKIALIQKLTQLKELQQSLNLSSEISKETTLASIPEKLQQDQLILDLAAIALKNGVILYGVNFGVVTSEVVGEIAKITVNANLSGSETALVDFLRGVEANTRELVVKSITVQLSESLSDEARVNFTVSMEAYYQGWN